MLRIGKLSPRIRLGDILTRWRLDAVALRGFSLAVEPGQRVILCGRTGS